MAIPGQLGRTAGILNERLAVAIYEGKSDGENE